jgi:hypothetical protein
MKQSAMRTWCPIAADGPAAERATPFWPGFRLTPRALLCKYAFMRTTVDLPDPLFRQVKSVAALSGSTLKEFIQDTLQQAVTSDRRVRRHKVRLPLIHSKHPGALRLTNADIEDHLA